MQVCKVATGRHQFSNLYYLEGLVADPYAVTWLGLPVYILDTAYVPAAGYHKADFVDHNPDLLSHRDAG
jgi:hypothetical protein